MKDPELFPTTAPLADWQKPTPRPGNRRPTDPEGETFSVRHDRVRLTGMNAAVFRVMSDGRWRTLSEIREAVGRGSEASISARLRDLRKPAHGGWTVDRRRRGKPEDGLFEYHLRGEV